MRYIEYENQIPEEDEMARAKKLKAMEEAMEEAKEAEEAEVPFPEEEEEEERVVKVGKEPDADRDTRVTVTVDRGFVELSGLGTPDVRVGVRGRVVHGDGRSVELVVFPAVSLSRLLEPMEMRMLEGVLERLGEAVMRVGREQASGREVVVVDRPVVGRRMGSW